MAVNRTPVLKRCRSLDLDPLYLGIDKKSRRKAKNAGRKISDTDYSFAKSRRLSSSMAY